MCLRLCPNLETVTTAYIEDVFEECEKTELPGHNLFHSMFMFTDTDHKLKELIPL